MATRQVPTLLSVTAVCRDAVGRPVVEDGLARFSFVGEPPAPAPRCGREGAGRRKRDISSFVPVPAKMAEPSSPYTDSIMESPVPHVQSYESIGRFIDSGRLPERGFAGNVHERLQHDESFVIRLRVLNFVFCVM